MQALPPTAALLQQIEEERHFSTLCKLYVAMTRRALYMLSDLKGKEKQTSLDFLVHCLGIRPIVKVSSETDPETSLSLIWESGRADWHLSLGSSQPEVALIPRFQRANLVKSLHPPTNA